MFEKIRNRSDSRKINIHIWSNNLEEIESFQDSKSKMAFEKKIDREEKTYLYDSSQIRIDKEGKEHLDYYVNNSIPISFKESEPKVNSSLISKFVNHKIWTKIMSSEMDKMLIIIMITGIVGVSVIFIFTKYSDNNTISALNGQIKFLNERIANLTSQIGSGGIIG